MNTAKACRCLALFTALGALSSCEVHNFGKSYDVPWNYIAVPVAVFCVVCLVAAQLVITRQTFRCPKCGAEFHPGRFELSAWLHINDDRFMKCPRCGNKAFCEWVNKK